MQHAEHYATSFRGQFERNLDFTHGELFVIHDESGLAEFRTREMSLNVPKLRRDAFGSMELLQSKQNV